MDPIALGAIALLLLVKEAGLPIPVPGDLVVLGAGAAAASGGPTGAVTALAAILLAGYVGGSVQFALVRRALRELVLGLLVRAGIPRGRLDTLAARLRQTGIRGVALARATPGVRVGAIAASGLSGMSYRPFLTGLVVGNGTFVGFHFALGLALGPAAIAVAGSAGSAAVLLVGALLALAALGALGWRVVARTRPRGTASAPGEHAPRAAVRLVSDWSDAACPACLALALAIPERGPVEIAGAGGTAR